MIVCRRTKAADRALVERQFVKSSEKKIVAARAAAKLTGRVKVPVELCRECVRKQRVAIVLCHEAVWRCVHLAIRGSESLN